MIFEPFFLESYMTGIKEMISLLGNTGTDLCRLRAAYIHKSFRILQRYDILKLTAFRSQIKDTRCFLWQV